MGAYFEKNPTLRRILFAALTVAVLSSCAGPAAQENASREDGTGEGQTSSEDTLTTAQTTAPGAQPPAAARAPPPGPAEPVTGSRHRRRADRFGRSPDHRRGHRTGRLDTRGRHRAHPEYG